MALSLINLLPYPVKLPNGEVLPATTLTIEVFKFVSSEKQPPVLDIRVVRIAETTVKINGLPLPTQDPTIAYIASEDVCRIANRQDFYCPSASAAGEGVVEIDTLISLWQPSLILPGRPQSLTL